MVRVRKVIVRLVFVSSGVGGCWKVRRVRQVLVVHLVSESQTGFAFSGFGGRDLVLVCRFSLSHVFVCS